MKEYKTTTGNLVWNKTASEIEYADNPSPPDGDGWELVSSATGELRYSVQPILWFWSRGAQ